MASNCVASGQQPPSSVQANLEILKLHWQKEVHLPRNFDPSVISTGSTFNDPASRISTQPSASTLSEATRSATRNQSMAAGSNDPFPLAPGRLPVFYVYTLQLRNTDLKPIDAIAWDYVFIDTQTNGEFGRHQFLSYERAAPGKVVTFRGQLRSPPIRIAQAAGTPKESHKLLERAIIQCVLYADETTWRNPQSPVDTCTLLKNGRSALKRKRTGSQA